MSLKKILPATAWLTLSVFSLFCLGSKFSQSQGFEACDVLTSRNGLSQNTVNCLHQDRKGFLWIGTQDGLNRYDGNQFLSFYNLPNNPRSLSNNYILSITEDSLGFIWIGTMSGGLNRYDPVQGVFSVFRHIPGETMSLSDDYVWAVAAIPGNSIISGTSKGLSVYDPSSGRFSNYSHSDSDSNSLPSDYVLSLFVEKSGIIWVGTSGGMALFDPADNSIRRFNQPEFDQNPDNRIIWSIRKNEESNLILATSNGIWIYHIIQHKFYPLNETSRLKTTAWSVLSVSEGSYFAGTANGLYYHDPEIGDWQKFSHKKIKDELPSNFHVWCLNRDATGTIWAGTSAGLVKIREKDMRFGSYRVRGDNCGLSADKVNSVLTDQNKTLWIGTEGGGLNALPHGSDCFKVYKPLNNDPNSLPGEVVYSLLQDRDGLLWIGTYGNGISVLDIGMQRFTNFQVNPNDREKLSNSRILALMEAGDGTIWIGTRGGGLNKYDKIQDRFWSYMNDPGDSLSIPSNTILSLAEEADGSLLVGTFEAGLTRFDPKSENFISPVNQQSETGLLTKNSIWDIHFNQKEELWLATQTGLVLIEKHLTSPDVHVFNSRHGLPGNVIFCVEEDKAGNLWLSTFRGISMLDRVVFDRIRNWADFVTDPFTPLFINYDVSDGLPDNEFNPGASFQTPEGLIYFGGARGVALFHPDSVKPDSFNPRIAITGIKIYNSNVELNPELYPSGSDKGKVEKVNRTYYIGQEIASLSNLVLSYREKVLSFSFSSLDFSMPDEILYAYRLEGLDQEWTHAENQQSATYTNLSPGSYVFRVKATNSGRVWSNHEASLSISVVPPFWQTLGFILFAAAIIIFSLFMLIKYIMIRRQRKITEEKEKIELQLRTIKNQIDPHFAFNAMNMIGSLVYEGDRDAVYDYFTRFAKMMRSTLNDSEKIFRPLADELEFVKNYLEIQQSRFKNKWDCNFSIDKGADLATEFPKMILQTHVENAIKHGLSHKSGKGFLEIKVGQKDRRLTVEITDDGIGRAKAAEMSRGNTGKGSQIVQQILSLYHKISKNKIEQEIIDLEDRDGNPCGTKVIMILDKSQS